MRSTRYDIRAHRSALSERSSDSGAILILVMIMLLVGGLLVGALAYAAVNDLHNTNNFSSVRNVDADAQSAITVAIQHIRYTPEWTETLNASPPGYCWGSATSTYATNHNNIDLWCSTLWTPSVTGSVWTRTVTISACEFGLSAATCAANPLVQAVVAFDDQAPGLSSPSNAQCQSYCGIGGMEVESWVERPIVPTVSHVGTGVNGLSSAIGPIGGGTTITLSGTGFVQNGETVNFIEESGNTPAPDNTITEATSVQYVSPTQITAVTPPATEGTTYFVTVTTPAGTSPYLSSVAQTSMVFTYTFAASPPTFPASTPQVTSISPSQGPTSGGTNVTISGANFVSASTVKFVDKTNPANFFPATDVTLVTATGIKPGTELSVLSPGVISDSTYYVEVTTPGGTSATSSGDIFTYTLLYPIVTSVSPASGVGPTSTTSSQITVYGENFFSGASVNLVPDNNSANLCPGNPSYTISNASQTNVVVDSPTQMTVNMPQTIGGPYCVEVTTSAGTSADQASAVFSYTPQTTSINPTSGSDASTTTSQAVVLSGYNFILPATVSFTPESGGTINSSAPVLTATASTVNGQGTQLTVNVPQVTSGTTTYYVSVSDSGGTETPSSSSPIYKYLPTVTSVSFNSSKALSSSNPITVTGELMAAATVVQLAPASGGTTVTLTSSQWSESGNTVTITAATGLQNNTNYIVLVTVGSATSTSKGSSGVNQFNY